MNVNINKSYIYIILSFLFVFILYNFSSQISIVYSKTVVPSGDPFSYELNLIRLNNESSSSIFLYFRNIVKTVVSGQWYYAYKIPIALFAPFIDNDHHNFTIINYLYFCIALISLNYSLNSLSKNLKINFLSSLVICFLPWMWGYKSYVSLHQMSLDTQVYLIGLAYFSLLFKCFLNIKDNKSLIFTALLGGFFTWTRGNAFAYFATLTFPIFVIFLIRYWKFNSERKILILKKIYKPLLLFLIIFGWFIFFTFESLSHYYSIQQDTINYQGLEFNQILSGIKIILFNYPGSFFTSANYSYLDLTNVYFSILFYLIIIFAFYFFKKRKKNLQNIKLFYLIFISILTILFSKLLEFYNIPFYANGIAVPQTQIMPLIPFSLMIVYLVNYLFQILNRKFKNLNVFYFFYFLLIFIFSVAHGYINTNFSKPNKFNEKKYNDNYFKRVVNPEELEKFSISLDKNIKNPKIYILLYNFYNPVIINYYREKLNLPTLVKNFEWESDIIAPFISDPNHRGGIEKFKKSFNNILKDADYIIMPKFLDDYKYMSHIIASQFYEEMYLILKDPNNPPYKVVKELNDVFDLVFLKKSNHEEKNNIFDGTKKEYFNVDMDINIFTENNKSFWFKFSEIKSYSDLLNLKKLKKIIFNKRINFPTSNLFNKNFDSFWEKNKASVNLLIGFQENINVNEITLFTENRKLKSAENYHNQSIERVPSEISIKGSNNLENWENIILSKKIDFFDEKANYRFINNKKYNYYLINLKNNENILRLYQIYFNNELIPNYFKETK